MSDPAQTAGSRTPNVDVRGPNPWLVLMVLGLGALVVGVWLIVSRDLSKSVVVVLLAIGLFISALSEFFWASGREKPWVGYLLGVLLAVGGVIVLTQQDAGEFVIALIVGITLILVGLLQSAIALMSRQEDPRWGWALAFGLVAIVIGILAIAWPGATVRVIGIIFGIRLVFIGVGLFGLGNEFRKLRSS
ncbi:MAG: HdeD family acid-resistance protein [Microthrixaceae bacterium]